ncbi:uncharacterized protein LOC134540336 [Bacillus rossius redtenbacheri]|uniref:uncharacterized protein LOC134540336 n=1 Tax=Bacillus rossius redtenbacheri TaxID=93214 RepID=UPI002FDD0756
MGQRSSSFLRRSSRPKISLTWVLRGDPAAADNNNKGEVPEEPAADRTRDAGPKAATPPPKRTLSEPALAACGVGRERARHRRPRAPRHRPKARFGYEIQDVDGFLSKASLEKPANIPMVLASPCTLYQTRSGGRQDEVPLPLGMVVNAVFKNQAWLYVQTPHAEEGYVSCGSCLPLGILPPSRRSGARPAPCWESHADVFPRPLGNRTDNEKLREGTRSECGGGGRCHRKARPERDAVSACGERSVDRLYLRAAASAKQRGANTSSSTTTTTLLVVRSDYRSKGRNTLSVAKGDVVALVSGHLKDWFWVRSRDGEEGFIPSVVAGHGFL